MTRRAATLAVLFVVLALAPTASAYLRLGSLVGSRIVAVSWTSLPIKYFITNRDVPNVTAAQLQTAVQHAFDTWDAVPTATISSQFGGFTSLEPADDSVSVIGFQARPELDRTLAATTFQLDSVTGKLIESDIFVNSAFPWSVAPAGEAGRYDVQSILTHEVGHFHGLSHSALGETQLFSDDTRSIFGKAAVMFPIAYPSGNIADRVLKPDDIAGISDIYTNTASDRLAQISGRVTLGGAGVFGAHVTAFNTVTGVLIGGFTLTAQGSFVISRLLPGLYVIRVEPIDDADVSSFFDDTSTVNVNFKPTYYGHLVSAPAGGAGASIEIKVTPK